MEIIRGRKHMYLMLRNNLQWEHSNQNLTFTWKTLTILTPNAAQWKPIRHLECLPFTQTTWVEIWCRNIKPKNWTRWEADPLQRIPKSAECTKRSHKISLPQVTIHIFWSCRKRMAWTIWFSDQNFWFFHEDADLTTPDKGKSGDSLTL